MARPNPNRRVYWVDLPNPHAQGDDHNEGEWVNVGTFDTRKEAVAFLGEKYGIPAKHASAFITKGGN